MEKKGAGCHSRMQGGGSGGCVGGKGGGILVAHPVLSGGAQSRTNELKLAY